MHMSEFRRWLVVLATVLFLPVSGWAGTPAPATYTSNAPIPSKVFTPGETLTVMVTGGAAGSPPSNNGRLSDIRIAGTNQFVVDTENCSTIDEFSPGGTCSITVRYDGSTPGVYTGQLLATCTRTPVSGAGGFTLVCDDSSQNILGVFTSNAAVAMTTAIDTLGPGGLAMLSALVLVAGAFATLRRRS